ncbi:UNVERIFIED_CONTAM: hypothetical protein FKN15_065090 [Acipenser sinensis]
MDRKGLKYDDNENNTKLQTEYVCDTVFAACLVHVRDISYSTRQSYVGSVQHCNFPFPVQCWTLSNIIKKM